jgi:hypothetical protein
VSVLIDWYLSIRGVVFDACGYQGRDRVVYYLFLREKAREEQTKERKSAHQRYKQMPVLQAGSCRCPLRFSKQA